METIVEVSEHSRTTSADSHRTEQNESEFDENPNLTLTMEKNSAEVDSGEDVFIRRESASEYYTAAESLGTTGSSFWNGETFTVQNQNVSSVDESYIVESKFEKLESTENTENVKPFFVQAENDAALDGKRFEWTFVINDCDELMISRINEDDEMPLEMDDNDFKLVKTENVFNFKIREVFPDDAGLYKLVASNDFGSATKTVNLNVEKEGSEPKIISRPNSTEVNENDLLTLSATTVGDPMPEIYWKLNGRIFHEGRTDGVIVTVNFDGDHVNSVLKIIKFDKYFAGKALFVAQNIHAEVQAPFNLSLIRASTTPKVSSDDSNVQQFDFRSQLKSRVNTKSLTADDLRSFEAEQIDFRSNLKKSKTAENLAEIEDEEHESTDELHKALAKRLVKQKNNQSTSSESDCDQRAQCAENSAASSSSKASTVQQIIAPLEEQPLSVSEEPDEAKSMLLESVPKFLKSLSPKEVCLGDPFELSVEVNCADEVIWTLEDQVIEAEPDEGLHLISEPGTSFDSASGTTHTLRVASSMMEDCGKYKVFLKTSYGQTLSSSTHITIFDPENS